KNFARKSSNRDGRSPGRLLREVSADRSGKEGGETLRVLVDVGRKAWVGLPHVGEAPVQCGTAWVKPTLDGQAVSLRDGQHHGIARRYAGCHRRGRVGIDLLMIGCQFLPVFLGVALRPSCRLPLGVGLAPALVCLLFIVARIKSLK